MSGASISFRANDAGVSSFMDNMKQKSSRMTADLIKDAQRQTDIAKEQLKLIESQIAAQQRKAVIEGQAAQVSLQALRQNRIAGIERRGETIDLLHDNNKKRYRGGEIDRGDFLQRRKRIDSLGDQNSVSSIDREIKEKAQQAAEQQRQNSLLGKYMKENVEAVKTTSQQELLQMKRGDRDLVNAIDENGEPTQRLSNQLASQNLLDTEKKDKKPDSGKNMWDLANAITLEKVGGMISNIPNTKNELDFVKPMMSAAGMIAGGLAGNVVDAISGSSVFGFSLGQTSFGPMGAQFGEKMGEFAGNAIERSFRSREALTVKNYKLQGLVGSNLGMQPFNIAGGATGNISKYNQNLSKYGLDYGAVSDIQYNVASRKGSAKNLGRDSENVVALEQGLGVRQDSSFTILELLRSNKESDKNLVKIIGGVTQKGQGTIFKDGDRSFLNEFLTKNYTQLQKTLLSTQNTVSSGTAFDILKRFDSVGGPFAARDSRSGGLINQIQGSLANPGSDNLKALSFTVMRKQNPGMGLAGLLEEQQKGMASPTYLKSMLEAVDQMGGNKDMKIMNVAGMFGLQGNLAAARRLYENQEALTNGSISVSQLNGTGAFSEGGIRSLGEQQTGKYTSSTAEIENAFTESAVKGVIVVGDKMKNLMGDMMDGMSLYVQQEIAKMIGGGKPVKQNKTKTKQTYTYGTRGDVN